MKNIDKKFLILNGILFFLVAVFFLSFLSPIKEKKKNVEMSALLNPKYKLSRFSLTCKDNEIVFYNFDDFWGAEFFNGKDFTYFPADCDKVNEFIQWSTKIIDLEKILNAKTKEQFDFYSLNEDAITVTYYDKNDNAVSTIHFGAMNQSMDKIFLWTEKNMNVYAMDSAISYYLDSDVKFWADQNIIPKALSKNLSPASIQNMNYKYKNSLKQNATDSAISKFPSFRFSEIINDFSISSKELNVELIDGSGTIYSYDFFPATTKEGNCYVFNLHITPSIVYTQNQKEFIKKINYYAAVSQWTFNSISKLLPEK